MGVLSATDTSKKMRAKPSNCDRGDKHLSPKPGLGGGYRKKKVETWGVEGTIESPFGEGGEDSKISWVVLRGKEGVPSARGWKQFGTLIGIGARCGVGNIIHPFMEGQ